MRKLLVIPFLLFGFLAVPCIALATTPAEGLITTAQTAGYEQVSYLDVISALFQVVLGTLGVVFVVFIVYGGFLWMTAGGGAEQVKKAKGILTNSIIGLIIVIASYAFTVYILERLVRAVTA